MTKLRSLITAFLAGMFVISFSPQRSGGQEPHSQNGVWQFLKTHGGITGRSIASLPPVILEDRLSPDEQMDAVKKLLGRDMSLAEFARPSAVAPQLVRLTELDQDAEAPARQLDVYFTAVGSLETLRRESQLEQLWESQRSNGEVETLSDEDLQSFGIAPPRKVDMLPSGECTESYSRSTGDILDRIRLETTGRVGATDSGKSILIAGYVDPRFRDHAQFGNRWRSLKHAATGLEPAGEAVPYDGAAYVIKVTPLESYGPLLFVEVHVVFLEPHGWFQGANLLRSKLPPAIQVSVRRFRRDLQKMGNNPAE